jgi:uncharacterized protein (DUF58 family)
MSGPRHAHDRWARTASLRLTGRGVVTLASVIALGLAEILSGCTGLLPLALVLGLPLLAAPVLVLAQGRNAAGAQIRAMVSPSLVAVGDHCELIIQLANDALVALPPLGLERPEDHTRSLPRAVRTPLSPPTTSRVPWWQGRQLVAVDSRKVIRWSQLGAGQRISSARSLPTGRRGVFSVGPLRLWAHDPFGLVGLPLASTAAVRVVVHPPSAPSTAPSPRPGVSSRAAMTSVRQGAGDGPRDDPGGELSGLRPYVPGDRLHLLSWSVEARYGALMVHEFRPDGDALISVVLDDRPGVHRRAAFEGALSMTYALVAEAVRHSFDACLSTLSGETVVVAQTPEGMVEFLTFLARAEPRRVGDSTPAIRTFPRPGATSTVVTTPTARASLPDLAGDISVVVVE